MKNIVLTLALFAISSILFSQVNPNNHYVQGYTRSDGTQVKGHYRTDRNSTNRDNYTTKPNTNPYTGKKGYIEPDNNYLPSSTYSFPTYSPPAMNYGIITPNDNYDSISYSESTYNTLDYGNANLNNSDNSIDYEEIEKEYQRWLREEYPKIQAEQERMFDSYSNPNKFFDTSDNFTYESPTNIAIKYHHKYSIEDRKIIELALNQLGYYVGVLDGMFDSNTISAIKEFQKNANVKKDGKVGPQTLKILSEQFE